MIPFHYILALGGPQLVCIAMLPSLPKYISYLCPYCYKHVTWIHKTDTDRKNERTVMEEQL